MKTYKAQEAANYTVEDKIHIHLSNCAFILGRVRVGNDFIKYRDRMKDNFESYEAYRTNYMKNLAADALLFEYLLLKNKVVDKPKSLAHDFILYDKKIDVKVVTKWLNISESKKDWLTLNVNNKLLDYCALIKVLGKPDRPFEEGDIVQFEVSELTPAKEIIDNLKKSNYNGYYYKPKEIA
jgi:hypothetical protein